MLVSQGGELLLTLWGILGWQDDLEVCTLPSELSSLGSNPDPAINCHPGVSQAGRFIDARVFSRMDVELVCV